MTKSSLSSLAALEIDQTNNETVVKSAIYACKYFDRESDAVWTINRITPLLKIFTTGRV